MGPCGSAGTTGKAQVSDTGSTRWVQLRGLHPPGEPRCIWNEAVCCKEGLPRSFGFSLVVADRDLGPGSDVALRFSHNPRSPPEALDIPRDGGIFAMVQHVGEREKRALPAAPRVIDARDLLRPRANLFPKLAASMIVKI